MVTTGVNGINCKCWTGNLTRPNWPAFLVYANNQNGVTGTSNDYYIQFVNTVVDTNSGWNGTDTYTIPSGYGGIWQLTLNAEFSGYGAADLMILYLYQTGSYNGYWRYYSSYPSFFSISGTFTVPCVAGDTFKVVITVHNAASNSVNVVGGQTLTSFCGVQVA